LSNFCITMAGTQFSAWTLFWAFIGLMMLVAGTARDTWVSGNAAGGVFGQIQDVNGNYIALWASNVAGVTYIPRKEFGTLDYRESAYAGYAYGAPNVCPRNSTGEHVEISDSQRKIDRVSAGMIALIILSNVAGIFASTAAVLAATNSVVIVTLKPARAASFVAAIFALVTWALWLRAHWELKDGNDKNCRIREFTASGGHNLQQVTRSVGGSFGLYVIGMGFYVFLGLQCTKLIKKFGENSPATQRWATLLIALIAYVCIFVGSGYNEWSTSVDTGAEKTIQNFIERQPLFAIDANKNGAGAGQVRSTIYSVYGVYTAQIWEQTQYPYEQGEDRKYICQANGGIHSDGSAAALISGGKITLSFCVMGMFIGTVACIILSRHPYVGFCLILTTLGCVVIALIVWALVPYYVIQLHCCQAPECGLGQSFGLIAGSGLLLFVSVYHQAWVTYNDVYVLNEQLDLAQTDTKSI